MCMSVYPCVNVCICVCECVYIVCVLSYFAFRSKVVPCYRDWITEHQWTQKPDGYGVCFTFYTAPSGSYVSPQTVALIFISIIKVEDQGPNDNRKSKAIFGFKKDHRGGPSCLVVGQLAGGLCWKQAYFLDLREWGSSAVAWVSAPPVVWLHTVRLSFPRFEHGRVGSQLPGCCWWVF